MMITPEDIHVLYSQKDIQARIESLAEEINNHYNGEDVLDYEINFKGICSKCKKEN